MYNVLLYCLCVSIPDPAGVVGMVYYHGREREWLIWFITMVVSVSGWYGLLPWS